MVRNALELLQTRLEAMADAEHAFRDALVEMSAKVTDGDLAVMLRDHAEQSLVQMDRLDEAFGMAELRPGRRASPAAKGIVDEYVTFMKTARPTPEVVDVMAAATALDAEHFEIASYRTLVLVARFTGVKDAIGPLTDTLHEEEAMASNLEQVLGRVVDALGERDVEGVLRQAALSLARETGARAPKPSGRRAKTSERGRSR